MFNSQLLQGLFGNPNYWREWHIPLLLLSHILSADEQRVTSPDMSLWMPYGLATYHPPTPCLDSCHSLAESKLAWEKQKTIVRHKNMNPTTGSWRTSVTNNFLCARQDWATIATLAWAWVAVLWVPRKAVKPIWASRTYMVQGFISSVTLSWAKMEREKTEDWVEWSLVSKPIGLFSFSGEKFATDETKRKILKEETIKYRTGLEISKLAYANKY